MCHHCGFHGTVPEHVCVDCGIQTHAGCPYQMPMCADDKMRCDMCVHDIHDAVCALCLQPDKECQDVDGTDRLSKTLIHYGRTWSRVKDGYVPDGIADDHLVLKAEGAGCDVVARLAQDPHSTFRPEELPQQGKMKMYAAVGETYLTSDPLVIHSWCQSAMQIDNVPDALDTPTTIPSYDPKTYDKDNIFKQPKATWETHACKFCDKKEGFTVFCFYHVTHLAGCRKCGGDKPTAFHPSCGVWHGLQRYTCKQDGQSGIGGCNDMSGFRVQLCGKGLLPSDKKLVVPYRKLLKHVSGVNNEFHPSTWDLDLDNNEEPTAETPMVSPSPKKRRKRGNAEPTAPEIRSVSPSRVQVLEDTILLQEDVEEIVIRRIDVLRAEMNEKMAREIAALRAELTPVGGI